MIKHRIIEILEDAVKKFQESESFASTTIPEIAVEHPQNSKHGDYACSLPLKLARSAGMHPLDIAKKIAGFIPDIPEIKQVTVAQPGFLNITLSNEWLAQQVEDILQSGDSYGAIDAGQGKYMQIEFVSVNPTGPLHVGHGRGAVLGSTLANVLSLAGYRVEKEYYINDAGAQLDAFYRSLFVRYKQSLGIEAEMPEDGYFGHYMIDLAGEIAASDGKRYIEMPEDTAIKELGSRGIDRVMASIREDLVLLDVDFDVWFSEKSLYTKGIFDTIMELLRESNHVVEKENAVWFISSALGEDKDNVLIRSDGSPTYFASDIAYHYDKFINRKFDSVIDIWGADHQGHISRMKAVLGTMDVDPERLRIIICQLVTILRGKEVVRVSKRSGDLITLREVIDEVGKDACRFVFLSRSADSQMEFDLELVKKQSADNPVYYVQYAHARIASILRLADEKGIDYGDGDVSLLTTEPELNLIRQMNIFPEIIENIAATMEPHHLSFYALNVATVFHSFYKDCRVVSDDPGLTRARLKLVKAAQTVLANTLHLMGMNAPESM
jgi:arginyl-tRNA synthetase